LKAEIWVQATEMGSSRLALLLCLLVRGKTEAVDTFHTLALTGLVTKGSLECCAAATLARHLADSASAGDLTVLPEHIALKQTYDPVGGLCAEEQTTYSVTFSRSAQREWIRCFARRASAMKLNGTQHSHTYIYPLVGGTEYIPSAVVYFTVRAADGLIPAKLSGVQLNSSDQVATSCPGGSEGGSLGVVTRVFVGCTDDSAANFDARATLDLPGACANDPSTPWPPPPPSPPRAPSPGLVTITITVAATGAAVNTVAAASATATATAHDNLFAHVQRDRATQG